MDGMLRVERWDSVGCDGCLYSFEVLVSLVIQPAVGYSHLKAQQ